MCAGLPVLDHAAYVYVFFIFRPARRILRLCVVFKNFFDIMALID